MPTLTARRHGAHRWFVVGVFLVFMLLHQSDHLLIGTLTPDIMDSFGISMAKMEGGLHRR